MLRERRQDLSIPFRAGVILRADAGVCLALVRNTSSHRAGPPPSLILLTCGTSAIACLCGAKARYFRYKERDRSAQLMAKEAETPREAFESSSSR